MTTYDQERNQARAALDDARETISVSLRTGFIAVAQVHANLALAAATLEGFSEPIGLTTAPHPVLHPDELLALASHPEGCCATEVRRLTVDSVVLNAISWRIAEALGDVPPGATCIEGDIEEQTDRLLAELARFRTEIPEW